MPKNAPQTTIKPSGKSLADRTLDRLKPWQSRLNKLLKNVRSVSDTASFRSDWAKVLHDAPAEQTQLLAVVPDLIDKWVSPTPPNPSESQRQWQEFYEAAKDRLPTAILETVLRRIPKGKPGEGNWDRFLLECRKPPLIEILLTKHLVRTQDLNRLARAHPKQFYQSAALDVSIRRRALRDVATVLPESNADSERASGLLSRVHIVVRWYLSTRGAKSDEQMSSILLASSHVADEVLALLLDHRSEALRLCQYLISVRRQRAKNTPAAHGDQIDQLLLRWLTRCDTELESVASPRQMTASLLIGVIHIALVAGADQDATTQTSHLASALTTLAKKAAFVVLLAHEENRPKSMAVVIRSHDLYHTVQEYLVHLHAATNIGDDSLDRASRFQRYQGRKEVIELVLHALDSSTEHCNMRDTLEAGLFNLGIRALEKADATVVFNFREHESDTPGTMDGDSVTVLSPGRVLGDADARIVLVRAKVHPKP